LAVVTDGTVVRIRAALAISRVGVGAKSRERVANTSFVALVLGLADHRVVTNANTLAANVVLSAEVVVIARLGVVGEWVGAKSSGWVANTNFVALVLSRANNTADTKADTAVASIAGGTQVVVIAKGSIDLVRVGALSSKRVANTSFVALIQSRASHSVVTSTNARVTNVVGGTQVAVIARSSIRDRSV